MGLSPKPGVLTKHLLIGSKPTDGFVSWRAYVKKTHDLPIGAIIKRGTPHLTAEEVYAYYSPPSYSLSVPVLSKFLISLSQHPFFFFLYFLNEYNVFLVLQGSTSTYLSTHHLYIFPQLQCAVSHCAIQSWCSSLSYARPRCP